VAAKAQTLCEKTEELATVSPSRRASSILKSVKLVNIHHVKPRPRNY
jgi:hypothetical protein